MNQTLQFQEKVLAEVRELIGEAEWFISYKNWETRGRDDAMALRKAVDDLKRKLATVRNRPAWLFKAFEQQAAIEQRRRQEHFGTGKKLTGLPMR